MQYPLLGPARGVGRGHRRLVGQLSADEARELLKKGKIESVRDSRTGLVRFFVLAKRPAELGQRAKIRPTCEHVVESERHLSGVSYCPSHNILNEIRLAARGLVPAELAVRS